MTDNEYLDNFIKNIEVERHRLGLTQAQMSESIGMSLSSYKRMLRGEMNLRASIVIKNLFILTGKCLWEYMEIRTPELEFARKVRSLDGEAQKVLEPIVEYLSK